MDFFTATHTIVKQEDINVEFNCHSFVLAMILLITGKVKEYDGDIARDTLLRLIKDNSQNQISSSQIIQKLTDHRVTYHIYHSGMLVHSGIFAPIEFQNPTNNNIDQLSVIERESSSYAAKRNKEYSASVAITNFANSVKDYYIGVNPSNVMVKFYAWPLNPMKN